ncbi:hypothetical protein D0T66_03760 [Dysgonomonas sp. 25]|nr:hypothetical protein [Dysgonomonas sp. 25]
MTERIEISFSKTKLVFGLTVLLSIVILIIAMFLFMSGLTSVEKGIMALGGLLALLGMVVIIKKMFDKTPAIIIDRDGIIDNTKKRSAGLIEWADISHISISQAGVLRVLLIHLHSPEKYLKRLDACNAQNLMQDYDLFGTPFAIQSSIIKISLGDLEALLNTTLERNR